VERQYDLLKYRFRERLGYRNPVMIMPYRGYGTTEKLYLRGRVLEDRGITAAEDDDSTWENLLNMYRRFKSNEIPYAKVRARFQGVEQVVTADVEGFFDVGIKPGSQLIPNQLWYEVELELVSPLRAGSPPVTARGEVLVPPSSAEYVVISDIDDTVLQTDAANLLRMARSVFLSNARMRLPFEGVAAFYRALHAGSTGSSLNPMFYVSNSAWNLYDLLSDFFNLHQIPIGPVLFLRDWGLSKDGLAPFRPRPHKLAYVREILDTFKHLPCILIGDSGEQDPEIYTEIVGLYPHRIRAVYIRNVSRRPKRLDQIKALAEQVLAAGSTLILAETTVPLAEHAARQGWIEPGRVMDVEIEKEADKAPPGPIEALLRQEKAEAPTVVVPGETAEKTAEAVDQGAIEEALETKTAAKEETPTVIVAPTENPLKKQGGEVDSQ
jgi:phosphatidate phosphatase APP1